jgi:hypothetical protein
MITTEFVPLNTKIYIQKIIDLEAENKALRKTIKIYNHILREHIRKRKFAQSFPPISNITIIKDKSITNNNNKSIIKHDITHSIQQHHHVTPEQHDQEYLHHLAEKYCENQHFTDYDNILKHKDVKNFLQNF